MLLQTSLRLFHIVWFAKCWQFFLELNSKRLYRSSGNEKESRCLESTSSKEREIRHFHVVVVQKCTKKAWCTCRVILTFCIFAVLVQLPSHRNYCRRQRKIQSFIFYESTRGCNMFGNLQEKQSSHCLTKTETKRRSSKAKRCIYSTAIACVQTPPPSFCKNRFFFTEGRRGLNTGYTAREQTNAKV